MTIRKDLIGNSSKTCRSNGQFIRNRSLLMSSSAQQRIQSMGDNFTFSLRSTFFAFRTDQSRKDPALNGSSSFGSCPMWSRWKVKLMIGNESNPSSLTFGVDESSKSLAMTARLVCRCQSENSDHSTNLLLINPIESSLIILKSRSLH